MEVAQSYRALGVEFFQDVLNLEPGQRWQQGLYQEIDACDLFLLFWSRSSSSSEWVAKEARYALEQQGKSSNRKPEIIPLILDGPPPPPPPDFLNHLHFNDWMRYAIEAAKPHKEPINEPITETANAIEASKVVADSSKAAATLPQEFTAARPFGALAPQAKADVPHARPELKPNFHGREPERPDRALSEKNALYLGSGLWIALLLAVAYGLYWLFK